jgi:hypothetical protein
MSGVLLPESLSNFPRLPAMHIHWFYSNKDVTQLILEVAFRQSTADDGEFDKYWGRTRITDDALEDRLNNYR